MKIHFWDSSALAKRFTPEAGSEIVDALFTAATEAGVSRSAVSLVYAETYSLLARKRNRGDISQTTFAHAAFLLEKEVAQSSAFSLLPVEDAAIYAAIPLIDRHSLNASDALMLVQYLRFADAQQADGVLIASDNRLLRTAQFMGLQTLDPEKATVTEVSALLSLP